jgi:hypothetical protein
MLRSLSDPTKTDKDTCHSYLDVYDELLTPLKDSAKNVLEVGILKGGSIEMWNRFFTSATVHAVDITPPPALDGDRIVTYTGNAYDRQWAVNTFKNITFDMVLDDGPHTLQSMVDFATIYGNMIAPNGVWIIEDVQDINWCSTIINHLPESLKKNAYVVDRRHIKGRYDDIIIIAKNV